MTAAVVPDPEEAALRCWSCGFAASRPPWKPKDGDLEMCWACWRANMYDSSNGRALLRPPTEQEAKSILDNPGVRLLSLLRTLGHSQETVDAAAADLGRVLGMLLGSPRINLPQGWVCDGDAGGQRHGPGYPGWWADTNGGGSS